MKLSITGFGACMIAGYPLPAESGFMHQAVQHLQRGGQIKPAFEIVAMGGFPAHRARKHFPKKVLSQKPDVVVIQFGSTDASAPLRNATLLRQPPKSGPQTREKISPQPPTSGDVLKWHLRSLASEVLRAPPLAPLEDYLSAVTGMVKEARAAGCRVVVLSPFVMGGGRSDRFARRYTRALAARLKQIPGTHFLDAHSLLARWPRKQILLRDGFHLSREGHEILGAALAEAIRQAAGEQLTAPSKSPGASAR